MQGYVWPTRHVKMRQIIGVLFSASVLTGCTTVELAAPFGGAARSTGISYGDAVDYLNTARKNVLTKQKQFDNIDTASKLGVAGGIAGVAINSAFRGSKAAILGFTTLGGLGYIASRDTSPTTLQPLYAAALANLSCIDAAGSDSRAAEFASRAALLPLEIDLQGRLQTLAHDVKTVTSDSAATEAAEVVLAQGRAVDTLAWSYSNSSGVAEHMVRAVTATIDALNSQLRSSAPSIDVIAQSSSLYDVYTGSSGTAVKQQAGVAATTAGTKALVQSGNANVQTLTTDERAIQDVTSKIAAALATTSVDVSAIGSCRVQFAASAPLTITPGSPLSLTAGSELDITPSGKPPFTVVWATTGAVAPTGLSYKLTSITQSTVDLVADPSSVDQTYSLTIVDGENRTTPAIDLSVHAKPTGNVAGGADQKTNNGQAGSNAGETPLRPAPPKTL